MKTNGLLKRAAAVGISACLIFGNCLSGSATESQTAPVFFEDFENATGNGLTPANGSKLYTYYGVEEADGKISLASKDDADTADYVINGNKSILVKHLGGDQACFGFGNDPQMTFSPDYLYTVSFKTRAITIPGDFRMLLQVMAWEPSNWGNEMYVKSDGNGGLAADYVVKNTGIPSLATPTVNVADNGDGIYTVVLTFSGSSITNAQGNYSSFLRWRFLGATASSVAIDDITVTTAPMADSAILSEGFEKATGTGIGAANGSFANIYYGGEDSNDKIVIAKADDPATSDYVLEGSQSIIVNHLGGDQGCLGFGNDSNMRFSPDYFYNVTFLMKTPALPADFRLLLQVMAWEGGNWGNEMYLKNDGSGNLVADYVVRNTGISSLTDPTISVESLGDNLYRVNAGFNGADISNANGYSSFFRLRPLGATASTFSVDDFNIYANSMANVPAFTEDFSAATGFNNWGVIEGTKAINFPRGADTNAFHAITDGTLVINKTTNDNIESFSFGNNDATIRFDPAKRYVFIYDLTTAAVLPSDFRVQMELMSWDAPNWSNNVVFAPDANGILTAQLNGTGAIIGGAAKKVSNGHYKLAIEFNGMANKNGDGKYSCFMRSVFMGAAGYSVAVDDFNVYVTGAATASYLPVMVGDTNDDQLINAVDAAAFSKYFVGTSSVDESILDVNRDGAVNIKDLIRLKRFIAADDGILDITKF